MPLRIIDVLKKQEDASDEFCPIIKDRCKGLDCVSFLLVGDSLDFGYCSLLFPSLHAEYEAGGIMGGLPGMKPSDEDDGE